MSLIIFLCLYAIVTTKVIQVDKEFFSQSFSDADFSSWTITSSPALTNNLATYCGTNRLFGGKALVR